MSANLRKGEARPKTVARADQLRPLNLPQPVEIALDDVGLPSVVTDSCTSAVPAPLRQGRVARAGVHECSGTETQNSWSFPVESILEIWRVDDEWWRESISRRYVEVILEGGKHVVLYEDLASNDWYMQMP